MPFVADCSVTIAWVFPDEATEMTAALRESLVSPMRLLKKKLLRTADATLEVAFYASPCFQFRLDDCLERLALLRRQISHLVLVVNSEEPELQACDPPVVDHPQPAAFALAAPPIGEPQLAKAPASGIGPPASGRLISRF